MDRTRASTGALSIEALLDEENKEVLAAMGNKRSRSANPPKASRGITPPPTIRSMLDVGGPAPRHGSIAGIGVGITNPRDQRKPSTRLNPADPSTWTKPNRAPSPKPESAVPAEDPSSQPLGLPRIQVDDEDDFEHKYNFDMASMPTTSGGALKNAAVKKDNRPLFSNVDSSEVHSKRRLSSEPEIPAASPKISRSRSPAGQVDFPNIATHTSRRMSNKSSSLSDLSDVPSELADRQVLDDEEAVVDSSDEGDRHSSSDGESPEAERGRGRGQKSTSGGKDKPTKPPQSKGVRSLLDPVPSPSHRADSINSNHTSTGFGRSGPNLSDFEDDPVEADILKAKNLGLSISPVDDSVKDRHVRMIIRGEWARFQGDSGIDDNNNNHTSRLYLVCSDLSTEASYALEWTVGTMLRDGDTLLAIYAIEDESAPKEPEGNREVMEESAKAAHDASQTMAALTRQTTNLSIMDRSASKFIPVTEASSLTGSLNAKDIGKREMERLKAMDEVTQNFLKLVRKTSLQVRCMVEVIHCKSPKHLILNAIDELDPTLCVVGTRGRSSLKGVLLGSFSNYLVTKSSVPVMVARKRLKKPRHAKVNSASIRLSNNLTNSLLPRQRKSLTQARID